MTLVFLCSPSKNMRHFNDFNIEDGSFLRMKMLQLAYNLPLAVVGMDGSTAKIYFTGNNVFQIVSNNFSGDDPEANFYGLNDRLRGYYNFTYPAARSFVLGLKINF
jgi:TonB-dependent starch-binding outer membrane protein SusC